MRLFMGDFLHHAIRKCDTKFPRWRAGPGNRYIIKCGWCRIGKCRQRNLLLKVTIDSAFPALPPLQKAAELVPEDALQGGLRVEGEGSLARASIECSLHTARIAEILIACNSASCIKI